MAALGPRSERKSDKENEREREREKRKSERTNEGRKKGRRVCLRPRRTAEASWITVGRWRSGRGGGGRGASSVFCSELLKTDSVVQSDAADGLSCCTRLAGSNVCQRSDFQEFLLWIKEKMKKKFSALRLRLDLVTVFSRFLSDSCIHLVNSL